jgi:hypothetical protein
LLTQPEQVILLNTPVPHLAEFVDKPKTGDEIGIPYQYNISNIKLDATFGSKDSLDLLQSLEETENYEIL